MPTKDAPNPLFRAACLSLLLAACAGSTTPKGQQEADSSDSGVEDSATNDTADRADTGEGGCTPTTELPYDGIDQDCDGADLRDVDGDGSEAEAVGGPDCADEDPAIHPGATELPYDDIDQDCDGADLLDVDGDGWEANSGEANPGEDCDDNDPTIHPGAGEVCDGRDEDCDGLIDTMVAGSTHPTIQEALDAACADDDTVWVLPGTYVENILFPARDLALRSTRGAAATIVDGSTCTRGPSNCSVLVLDEGHTGDTLIWGLTFRGGLGSYDASYGGCPSAEYSCGGGILLRESAATLQDNFFEANEVGGSGGGLYVDTPPGYTLVEGNTFLGNLALVGGGASIDARGDWSRVDVLDNELLDNMASNGGGGIIYRYHEDWGWFTDNRFERNISGGVGGGLICWYGAFNSHTDAFAGNSFIDNVAATEGGGLFTECEGSGLTDDNFLSGNSPTDCSLSDGGSTACD